MNFKKIRKLNIFKTVYISALYKSKILIGKNTDLNLNAASKIEASGGTVRIGVDYSYNQKTVLDINKNGKLILGKCASINSGSKVVIGENACLTIGSNSYVNEHSRIQCRSSVTIGEDCAISWGVNILDTDEHYLLIEKKESKKENCSPVVIGNHVWIGCNSIVLKGVTLGEDCVVAAGSVVTKSFPPKTLLGGNPAKIIRDNISWK
jgi:acetyltransferase-like isoleucine patch superfamily enzyme